MLIIRMIGDEATGALVGSQFVAWIVNALTRRLLSLAGWFTGRLFTIVLRPFTYFDLNTANFRLRKLRLILCSLPVIVGTAALASRNAFGFGTVLGYGDRIVTFFAFFAGAMIIVTTLLTAIIAVLPYGVEVALASPWYEVVSETTPLGRWEVETFATPQASPHSSAYFSLDVLDRIEQWIKDLM